MRAMGWLALLFMVGWVGCVGGSSEPRSNFYCVFQQRETPCNSNRFGAWENRCVYFDFEIRDDLTPQTACENSYPPSDSECQSTCCIQFEYSQVHWSTSCPY